MGVIANDESIFFLFESIRSFTAASPGSVHPVSIHQAERNYNQFSRKYILTLKTDVE